MTLRHVLQWRRKEGKAVSQYTTGEIAKLCGVTVRTVQYYDTRGILTPSSLSEGGRRLYAEDDLKRMKIICFLRELGLSIDSISRLLKEPDPGSVISLLLDQQEAVLRGEITERETSLRKLSELKAGLRSLEEPTVESIGDIAYTMTNKKALKKLHMRLLLTALPLGVLQWGSIALGAAKGWWGLVAVWAVVAVPYGIWLSRYYFDHVNYICPKCHRVFKPALKQAFWAAHTPNTRKLTCPDCGHHGYCVEVAAEAEVKADA